jgi:hypothetical protein
MLRRSSHFHGTLLWVRRPAFADLGYKHAQRVEITNASKSHMLRTPSGGEISFRLGVDGLDFRRPLSEPRQL